ncbi:protein phosphatase 2C domain-containing protein [bacterium]|nr:protein phosphatase 2C domain-containing protein [bacterium]
MNEFEMAGGTIVGRRHKKIGKNNQDAFFISAGQDSIIGLVSDGCGSGKYSEFGARLLVKLTVKAISRYLALFRSLIKNQLSEIGFWDLLRETIQSEMINASRCLGGDLKQTISDYLLATIVGFIVVPEKTIIFSIGDGEAYLNEYLIKFGSFPGNAPPYLAYSLLKKEEQPFDERFLHFSIDQEMPTNKVKNLLIATDGIEDLRKAEEKMIPGRDKVVGPISQWWKDDKYFENPDMVRRQLFLINNEGMKIRRDSENKIIGINRFVGLLPDDTTLVVLRRRHKGGEKDGD